jgi:hypothetical protein
MLPTSHGDVPYATRNLVLAATGSRISLSVRAGLVQERPASRLIDPSMQGTRRKGRSCVGVENIAVQGARQAVRPQEDVYYDQAIVLRYTG